jgi:branched-chain amino acid transport system substrate-binding protein
MRNFKLTLIFSLILILLGNFFLGCKKEPKTIKIGAIVFLTGPQAMLGEEVKNGLLLALDEINKEGGINGKKLELILTDSKDSPKDAIMAFNMLLSKNVSLILCTGDVVTLNLAPLADKHQIPLVTVVGAGPGITENSKWTFRFFVRGDYQAKLIASYASEDLKIRTVAILYLNNEYGVTTSRIFKETFESKGGRIVASESYNITDKDVRSQISKLLNTNPQAVYLTGFGEGYAVCIKQLRELGFKGLILTSECELSRPVFRGLTLPAANGAYYVDTPFDEIVESSRAQEFVKKYQNKYGVIPSFFSAFAYDALRFITLVIKKAGTSKESIKEALLSTKMEGVFGTVSFNQNRDLEVSLTIKKLIDGKPVVIKTFPRQI